LTNVIAYVSEKNKKKQTSLSVFFIEKKMRLMISQAYGAGCVVGI
jgi:hypothetical protein